MATMQAAPARETRHDQATAPYRRPRIAFIWSYISGYMAACWRAMHARGEVDLLVGALRPTKKNHVSFKDDLMEGFPSILWNDDEFGNQEAVIDRVAAHKPDAVVICGWAYPTMTAMVGHPKLRGAKFIMGMDTPYLGTLRQHMGRYAKRTLFQKLDHVVVTGERCHRLARVLGFPESKITRGVYGIDFSHWSPLLEQRRALPGGWPKSFVYMGRYIPEKAIDVMLAGYTQYRQAHNDPWPLTCMGMGPFDAQISATPGVRNLGFVQPADQPAHLLESGVFILASRFDPWPLVVVESCAAGLPIICTDACGSAIELVRTYYNGRIVPTEDPASLARAMSWMHRNHHLLPEFGRRGREFAAAYSTEAWCDRWTNLVEELMARA